MSGEPKHYSIILVHGTWARGLFPVRPQPISDPMGTDKVDHSPATARAPYWFDRGSYFRNQLVEALNMRVLTLSYDIRVFQWSGGNSFMARRRAAVELAEDIKKISLDNPNARIVCVAHSHGGNVALYAVQLLKGVDLSNPNEKKIDIITLATPFVQMMSSSCVQDKSLVALSVQSAVMTAFGLVFWFLSSSDLDGLISFIFGDLLYLAAIAAFVPATIAFYAFFLTGHFFRATVQTNDWPGFVSYSLTDKPAVSLLALRSVDDEAGLALAIGRVGARLDTILVEWLLQSLPGRLFTVGLYCVGAVGAWKLNPTLSAIYAICTLLLCFAFPLLSALFRGSAGRELIRAGVGYSIAINSFPDTTFPDITWRYMLPAANQELCAATIVPSYAHRRHALYSFGCADFIVTWIDRDWYRAYFESIRVRESLNHIKRPEDPPNS
jgi:putative serine esterase DUF676